jgi:hypothetical protein
MRELNDISKFSLNTLTKTYLQAALKALQAALKAPINY